MKRKGSVISVILVILFLLSFSARAFAEDIGNLLEQQTEVRQKQEEANKDLELVQEELTANLQQIQGLEEQISGYEAEIKQLDEKTSVLESSIAIIEGNLKIAQESYDKQKGLLDARLIAIYESGNLDYLDVLLNSKNMSEFISNYFLVTQLTKYDTDFLENIERQKKAIEANKEKLEAQKQEYNLIKLDKEKTAIILKNARAIQGSYLIQLTEKEQKIQEDIQIYRQQIEQVENEIRAAILVGLDSKYIGGEMAWPVPGYTRITSPFGMRTHPITGIYKLHTGVDIGGAPIGANFIAANDGIVIKAEPNVAYGNMVLIDHGGGISTLYAHGSEIVVMIGQKVTKGDVVLKVGNTGYSTGPHAHFEVRVNGTPVDPIPYITTTVESSKKTEE